MSDVEHGVKWWFRYVVVPVLGGGGLIAIVIAFIGRPQAPQQADLKICPPQTVQNDKEPSDPDFEHLTADEKHAIETAEMNLDASGPQEIKYFYVSIGDRRFWTEDIIHLTVAEYPEVVLHWKIVPFKGEYSVVEIPRLLNEFRYPIKSSGEASFKVRKGETAYVLEKMYPGGWLPVSKDFTVVYK